MDLLCERCGEPWEAYYVQCDMTTTERERFHHGEGCPTCFGKEICTRDHPCFKEGEGDDDMFICEHDGPKGCKLGLRKPLSNAFARQAQAAFRDVLGDDIDGLAAEMEDLGFT